MTIQYFGAKIQIICICSHKQKWYKTEINEVYETEWDIFNKFRALYVCST